MITNVSIIEAPDGISNQYDKSNPVIHPRRAINIETKIIFLKFLVNRLAIVWGMVRREMIRIIHITLIFNTMVRATRPNNR